MVYPLEYMDKASQSRQCPYCAEPFEPRYLYTSGGCGIFITQTKKIKRPVVSISKGMLEDLNPAMEVLAGPHLTRFSESAVPILYCPKCKIIIIK